MKGLLVRLIDKNGELDSQLNEINNITPVDENQRIQKQKLQENIGIKKNSIKLQISAEEYRIADKEVKSAADKLKQCEEELIKATNGHEALKQALKNEHPEIYDTNTNTLYIGRLKNKEDYKRYTESKNRRDKLKEETERIKVEKEKAEIFKEKLLTEHKKIEKEILQKTAEGYKTADNEINSLRKVEEDLNKAANEHEKFIFDLIRKYPKLYDGRTKKFAVNKALLSNEEYKKCLESRAKLEKLNKQKERIRARREKAENSKKKFRIDYFKIKKKIDNQFTSNLNVQEPCIPCQIAEMKKKTAIYSPVEDIQVKELIKKSPTLTKDLEMLKKQGWVIKYGPPGEGSYCDKDNQEIVIDSSEKENTISITQTLAHEVGHALYTKDEYVEFNGLTKDDYVKKNVNNDLKDEGEATLKNCEIRDEILKNSGNKIDIKVSGSKNKTYINIYENYKKHGNREKARQEIANVFNKGETPSTAEGKTYGEYYGEPYAEHYDKYAGKK